MKRFLLTAAAVIALASSCSVKAPEGAALFDWFKYEGADDFYAQNPLPGDDYYYNPIINGWYSDPSICSNGQGDYFLVTSTFVYFPGVPIFHSRDLVNWEQIGNVLDRPEQLPTLDRQRVSGGIYAPDIQYNPANKTYYMITTDVAKGNFYVKTKDPWGSWSDPIYVPVVTGIDPSFFFDDNGKAYIVSNDAAPDGKEEYNGHRTIRCVEFDVKNDCTVGERKIIVNKGSRPEKKPYWIEGPHLYKINGTYYLMCAEGGTNFGEWHSEVVFKGESPFGPFVSFEGNPILTQVGLDPARPDRVDCTGHADLVQDGDGKWWAVFLGDRPYRDNFENLGRETFMLPVNWTADGFPVILPEGEQVPLIVRHEGVKRSDKVTFGNFSIRDDFDGETPGDDWMTLRSQARGLYSLKQYPGYLKLVCSDVRATSSHTPAFFGHRLHHHSFSAQTRMYFTPSKSYTAGLLLFKDERHQYYFKVSQDGISLDLVGLDMVAEAGKPMRMEESSEALAQDKLHKFRFIDLKVTSDGETFSFWYAPNGGRWHALIEGVDASILTSAYAGGFTGTLIGPYAVK